MASYQARQRDPLLDSNTQAIIERRGKELLGFGLMTVGFLVALTLWSYSADDPSWLSVTDGPVRNLLGRFGASVASPLIVISGAGAWGIAVAFLAWGVRFLLHIGAERALARAIFAPIALHWALFICRPMFPAWLGNIRSVWAACLEIRSWALFWVCYQSTRHLA